MIDKIIRVSSSYFWKMSQRNARNRDKLYRGNNGLRSITFHDILPNQFDDFRQIIEWCQTNYEIADPLDAEQMLDGKLAHQRSRDSILITFDDGHESNYRAAEWLHKIGINATFFIVPSFIDRLDSQYIKYHRSRGVSAYSLQTRGATIESRGLSRNQVSEMIKMGHKIAAHNYAHRDLGKLSTKPDLEYEILNSINSVNSLTGQSCRDFAVGFGQPENLSDAAIEYLSSTDYRVYMCFRGQNTPGISPRYFLRHGYLHTHPFVFTTICLQAGADHMIYDRHESLASRIGLMPEHT